MPRPLHSPGALLRVGAALLVAVLAVGCGTLIASPPNLVDAIPDPCGRDIEKAQQRWQRAPDYSSNTASGNVVSTNLTWIVRGADAITSHSYTFASGGLFGRCHTSYSTSSVRLVP